MTQSSMPSGICGEAQPREVLHFFEELCKIPHGSFHVEEISNALVTFAKERNLEYVQDESFNVIIKKKASEGAADRDPIILQGHIDMVLDKEPGCQLDLEREPIKLCCDGEYLYADGTTLGGDDGIAAAMMMALLDDDTIPHPPLECVFTTNEEVGLLGASALDTSVLQGRRMINLDSEKEGIFIVGCAGGAQERIHLPIKRKKHFGKVLTISVTGLLGGHSGMCVGMGRANADLLMGRALSRLRDQVDFRLICVEGGLRDNAIPRSCCAELLVNEETDAQKIQELIGEEAKKIAAEYRETDPNIVWSAEWKENAGKAVKAITRKDTAKVIAYLMLAADGVLEWEPLQKGLPRTSLNLGILKTTQKELTAVHMIRSSVNAQKDYVQKKIQTLVHVLGGSSETESAYPAWERGSESPLCDAMVKIYEKQTGEKPAVTVFHCGLECGLFTDKMKGLDCVSIGPDMMDVHTANEKLSIASTERTWKLLLAILQEI